MDFAELILGLSDTQFREVVCPEWVVEGKPVTLVVRSLQSSEKDDFEIASMTLKKSKRRGKVVKEWVPNFANVRAKLVAMCVCKAIGDTTRVFSDAQIERLGTKNIAVLDRLYSVACELNGVRDEDEDEILGKEKPNLTGECG